MKRIFSGWMYAASPVCTASSTRLDIWLTDCKGPDQTIVSAQPDRRRDAPPPAASVRRSRSRRHAPAGTAAAPQFQPQPQQARPPRLRAATAGGLFGGLFGINAKTSPDCAQLIGLRRRAIIASASHR